MPEWSALHGDCRELMAAMPQGSIHAVVTDPPYGLSEDPPFGEVLAAWQRGEEYAPRGSKAKGFCGEGWDAFVPGPDYWRHVYRVLAPGGHALVFAGTRTWDLTSLALRMAGFENRDTIADFIGPSAVAWVHSQGMGKGARLKPAWEPILVFRKPTPLAGYRQREVTGTGSLNIDAARLPRAAEDGSGWHRSGSYGSDGFAGTATFRTRDMPAAEIAARCGATRYPPNVVLTAEAAAEMDRQSGTRASGGRKAGFVAGMGYAGGGGREAGEIAPNSGGSSRFYPCFNYCPKPTRAEKERGCEAAGLPVRVLRRLNPGGLSNEGRFAPVEVRNNHLTVKPVSLMRWLISLCSWPGQTILDPFCGSGTTGVAALREGRHFIGMEKDQVSWEIATARVKMEAQQPFLSLFSDIALEAEP